MSSITGGVTIEVPCLYNFYNQCIKQFSFYQHGIEMTCLLSICGVVINRRSAHYASFFRLAESESGSDIRTISRRVGFIPALFSLPL